VWGFDKVEECSGSKKGLNGRLLSASRSQGARKGPTLEKAVHEKGEENESSQTWNGFGRRKRSPIAKYHKALRLNGDLNQSPIGWAGLIDKTILGRPGGGQQKYI